jgi:hypothetical protein
LRFCFAHGAFCASAIFLSAAVDSVRFVAGVPQVCCSFRVADHVSVGCWFLLRESVHAVVARISSSICEVAQQCPSVTFVRTFSNSPGWFMCISAWTFVPEYPRMTVCLSGLVHAKGGHVLMQSNGRVKCTNSSYLTGPIAGSRGIHSCRRLASLIPLPHPWEVAREWPGSQFREWKRLRLLTRWPSQMQATGPNKLCHRPNRHSL